MPPPPPVRPLGRSIQLPNLDLAQLDQVQATCEAIAGFVVEAGRPPPTIGPGWRRAVLGLLDAGVERAEVERVMRWALCVSDWWPTSGCEVPGLLARFDLLRQQAGRTRQRAPANPLTVPMSDRSRPSGLVAL